MIRKDKIYKPKLIPYKGVHRPGLILCSDFHLREDTPLCYTGDFQEEQWNSVTYIANLQKVYDCPVVHGGDLFDHWKPSPWLLRMTMKHLPKCFYTVYGQHDLPQHNLELVDKCGIDVLKEAGKLVVLRGCHYGQTPKDINDLVTNFIPSSRGSFFFNDRVLVWHHMTYLRTPYPGAEGGNARSLLIQYPQYDLIVTGDNHTSFCVGHEGRLLVNPGNLTRQEADQIDYQPRIALWYAEDNIIEWVNIPIKEGVITRDHIEERNKRDARIDAFISRLDKKWEVGTSFEQNLEEFIRINKIPQEVTEIVYKALET